MDLIVSYIEEEKCVNGEISEQLLKEQVVKNINKELKLVVLNLWVEEYRTISITPSRQWKHSDSLLGCLLRLEPIHSHTLTNTYLLSYTQQPQH